MRSLCYLLLFGLLFTACNRQEKDLPVFGQMPEFRLTDSSGKAFTAADLQGKASVVNFIFTSCGMTCPMLTKRMKGVQDEILQGFPAHSEDKIRIVSFSVDPERDTPERLAAYAREYGAEPRIWVFLTGPLQEVTRTVVDGFKISMGKQPVSNIGEGEIFEVVHGEKFVLVDRQGRIRGYYDSDRAGIKRMLADLKALIGESSV